MSVAQGLFAVGLGDTLIPNMSALTPQVLANPDVRLRMWFNDGVNGFSQLSPNQCLTSAAYAMMADTVRDGAITAAKLAPNSITSAQIAPGSITASQLADGTVTSAKLAARVQKNGKPLFVVQGKNNPRVPVTEAEQMVKAIRENGGQAWYLMAKDEGHGFAKKKNANFQFISTILFYREHLLK